MPTAVRAPARAPERVQRPNPRPEAKPTPRPHLRVVPDSAARRRRLTPATGVLITSLLFAGLFALAVAHTLLIQGQIQLDQIDAKVAEEQARYQQQRLTVAQLESPERIVAEAQSRLGMVPPNSVIYLSPKTPADKHGDQTLADDEVATQADAGGDVLANAGDGWTTVKPLLESAP
jgi:cell division protein FtsL